MLLLLACAPDPEPLDSGSPPVLSGELWSTAIYGDELVGVDLATGDERRVEVGASPIGLVHDAPTGRLFATAHQADSVSVVLDGALEATVEVGGLPYWVVARERELFVANSGENSLSVLDADRAEVVRDVELEGGPIAMAFGDDHLFVVHYLEGALSAIDPATGEVAWVAEELELPVWVAVHGDRLFVAESRQDTVAVLDLWGELLDRFDTGETPTGLVPLDEALLVLTHTGDELELYDLQTYEPVGSIPLSGNPVGTTWSPDRRHLAVAASGDDRVDILDVAALEVVASLPVGDGPRGLAWIEETP